MIPFEARTAFFSTAVLLYALSSSAFFAGLMIQYGGLSGAFSYVARCGREWSNGAALTFLLMAAVSLASRRVWVGFTAVSLLIDAACTANELKLAGRGMPLLPWDYTMASEAAGVAGRYAFSVTPAEVAAFGMAAAAAILLARYVPKLKGKMAARAAWSAAALAGAALFINAAYVSADLEAGDTSYRVYRVADYYEDRGFVTAFLEYLKYLGGVEAPEGYGKEKMEETAAWVREAAARSSAAGGGAGDASSKPPNIVAVMSESFWDVTELPTVATDSPLLPNFSALCSEGISGHALAHVQNGGTVVSEFEFLTGFSGEFFPTDYMVYGGEIGSGFASAASFLESRGCFTAALHPNSGSNYNRLAAYGSFGFERILFEEAFPHERMLRGYVSDAELFDEVVSVYEENKENAGRPAFIFTVTMQNHGGYWEDTLEAEWDAPFSADAYGSVTRGSIADYLAGLRASDAALGELADYFREQDEETVIIYFGDHVSDAGAKGDRLLGREKIGGSDEEYDCLTHLVPFVIWDNKWGGGSDADAGVVEIGQILPLAYKSIGLEMNAFDGFLLAMREAYGATSSSLLVGNDGTPRALSEMTEQQRMYYDAYRLLQYDYIWGGRYAEELWETG